MEQKIKTPKTKVRIMDSVAGAAPEFGIRDFSYAPQSVILLDARLAEKWLASGLAMEVHPDEPLYNPMEQKGRRFF
jgi:hypothetical protein